MTTVPVVADGNRDAPVWIGLGSNMGDRLDHLRKAVFALALHPEIEVRRGSRVYETAYVGPGTQERYLNACLELETSLEPKVLLAVLKGVEERFGRVPAGHMKPRPIDLDILLWRGRTCSDNGLTIPHPRARERGFVLEPLAELAPQEIFPDSGETIRSACAKIRRKSAADVRLLAPADGCRVRLLPGGTGSCEPTREEWRAALAVHCR